MRLATRAWEGVRERETRDDRIVTLEHGKPLVFGKNRDRGIRLNGFVPEVVSVGEGGVAEEDLLHHDEKTSNPSLPYLLSQLHQSGPEFPTPMGVFRALEEETYDEAVHNQISSARASVKVSDLNALLREGDTWEVSGD